MALVDPPDQLNGRLNAHPAKSCLGGGLGLSEVGLCLGLRLRQPAFCGLGVRRCIRRSGDAAGHATRCSCGGCRSARTFAVALLVAVALPASNPSVDAAANCGRRRYCIARAFHRCATGGGGVAARAGSNDFEAFEYALSARAAGCACCRCRVARTVRYDIAGGGGVAAISGQAGKSSKDEIPGGSAGPADRSSIGAGRACRSAGAAKAAKAFVHNCVAAGATTSAERGGQFPSLETGSPPPPLPP